MPGPQLPVLGPPGTGPEALGEAPSSIMPRAYEDEEIKDAFDTFDLDHNKFVGVAELKHILAIIGESADDAELDEMIRMCDTDGDGQVTYDEFYKLFHNPPGPPRVQVDGPAKLHVKVTIKKPPAPAGLAGPTPAGLTAAAQGRPMESKPQNVGQSGVTVAGNEGMDVVMKKFTGGKKLKPVYIKKLYKAFKRVDKDNSGRIDYQEYLQVMEEEDHPLMQRMFNLFDSDKSGYLELKEFIVGLSNYTSAAKADKLKFAFMMFDENGSGYIERGELLKVLSSTFRVDGSAQSLEDQRQHLEARATQVLKELNLPPDGSISYEKFMELAKNQPNLLYPALCVQKTVSDKYSIDQHRPKPTEGLLQQQG